MNFKQKTIKTISYKKRQKNHLYEQGTTQSAIQRPSTEAFDDLNSFYCPVDNEMCITIYVNASLCANGLAHLSTVAVSHI